MDSECSKTDQDELGYSGDMVVDKISVPVAIKGRDRGRVIPRDKPACDEFSGEEKADSDLEPSATARQKE